MTPGINIYRRFDWTLIVCYIALTLFGWINIYASTYSEEAGSILSLANRSGNQAIWILAGTITALVIMFFLNFKIIRSLSWPLYLLMCLLLVAVLVVGREVNGSKSWIVFFGSFAIQPSEFSKISTALCVSFVMSRIGFRFTDPSDFFKVAAVVMVPILLIALEPDVGTILVYCGLAFVMYREQMPGKILAYAGFIILLFLITLKFSPFASILTTIGVIGIIRSITCNRSIMCLLGYAAFITAASFIPALLKTEMLSGLDLPEPEYILLIILSPVLVFLIAMMLKKKTGFPPQIIAGFLISVLFIFSTEFIFEKVLKPHHRDRIENLLGITEDLKGAGYNVNQSKIAIGSGGLTGKGFLNGTQTKFNFVPEQSTDFIFCTVGEEWGFIGTVSVILVFFILIARIIITAERNREPFTRIFGYCVASFFFMHVFINIGMTIGIMPVIGIPLPFFSYGGSSFLTFTILLFLYIRLDVERWN